MHARGRAGGAVSAGFCQRSESERWSLEMIGYEAGDRLQPEGDRMRTLRKHQLRRVGNQRIGGAAAVAGAEAAVVTESPGGLLAAMRFCVLAARVRVPMSLNRRLRAAGGAEHRRHRRHCAKRQSGDQQDEKNGSGAASHAANGSTTGAPRKLLQRLEIFDAAGLTRCALRSGLAVC